MAAPATPSLRVVPTRAPARPRCVAALAMLLAPSVHAQVKILAPDALAQAFHETGGVVYGTTATFGAPYYGERVMGRLIYGETHGGKHCSADDYELDMTPASRPAHGEEAGKDAELVNVVLVRRGGCSFVQKVQLAQEKQAHAVIVVDREDSSDTSEDIQKIVMADNGYGHHITIPSVLISRFEGQKLINAAKNGEVLVELVWDIPRGEVVVADFWMSSGSRESSEFLDRFQPAAETLMYHMQFIPHYHIFSLQTGARQRHNGLCVEQIDSCGEAECPLDAERFCAPDPDGTGPISGGEVANEDLRQLCVWNTTLRARSFGDSKGPAVAGIRRGYYSREFWDYVVRFRQDCRMTKGIAEEHRFGYSCSLKAMRKVGIDVQKVETCVRRNYREFLEEQLERIAWSPQALRLNGWRYSGPLDPETVLKAVCAGFPETPRECEELLSGYQVVPLDGNGSFAGVTVSGLLTTIFGLALATIVVFILYRRHVTRSVRRVLREEVMLEVQAQMSDYVYFEDADSGQLSGTQLGSGLGIAAGGSKPLSF